MQERLAGSSSKTALTKALSKQRLPLICPLSKPNYTA